MRLGLRNVAFYVNFGVGHPRLGLSQLAFGLIQHGLKWTRINFEKNLAVSDKGAFVIVLTNQIAAYLRRDLRVDVAVERPHPLSLNRHVFLDDACYFDCGRLR